MKNHYLCALLYALLCSTASLWATPAVKYALCDVPDGWTVTADGNPVTPSAGKYLIEDGQAVVLTPPSAVADKVVGATLDDVTGLVGSGTADDPYLIYTVADWNALAALVNNGTQRNACARQMANLSDINTVIGNTEARAYQGHYDGNGYIISNIFISTTAANPLGLFGSVSGSSAVIENVVVTSGKVSSTQQNVGGIVGKLLDGGTVRYCANYAEVTSSSTADRIRMAGIVGWEASGGNGPNSRVEYCINYGYIHGKSYIGGIVGAYGQGHISYCQNYGNVVATGTSGCGIAGWQSFDNNTKMTYNHVGGNITVSSKTDHNHIICNTSYTWAYSNTNTYYTGITITVGSDSYTGSSIASNFITGATAVSSNPAGITISGVTFAYNTAAPSPTTPTTNAGTDPVMQSNGTWTFTMPSRNRSAAVVTAPTAISGLVYTGVAQALVTAGTTNFGTMKYSTDNSTWSADIPAIKNAGNYTVYYMIEGDANHSDFVPSPNTINVSINKAPLTITADEKYTEYGDYTYYEMSYSGFVGSDGPASLSSQPTLSSPYHVGDPAGTYDIILSGGASANYDITLVNSVLHVNKAPLTVKADNKQTVYGVAAPAYTATITGFVLGEDESVLGGALSYICAYTVGSGLGNYTITPSGLSADNYQFFYQNGTLAVSAPTSITFADNTDNLAVLEALYGETMDVTIGRTFKGGIYNTCCLPFDMSASEIAASPLAGAILKDYIGADVTGEGAERELNIHLADLTEIVAGKPFLIKPETNIVNPVFTQVTVGYDELMGQMVEAEHVDFQGILSIYDLAAYSSSSPDYLGIGNDGRLYWADASISTGPMRGYRAFFHVKDAGSSNNSPVRRGMHAQFVEDSHKLPTDVEIITGDQSPMTCKIIENGVLYIIRNGKIYNATGAQVK